MGGGGNKKGGNGSTPASDAQMQMAQQLFSQTDPIRQSLIGQSQKFLSGGNDVMQTPAYGALKLSADQNFNQAKDNLISTTAPGGALTSALTNLEGSRANTLTQGAGSLYGDALSRATTLGTGMTGQSLSALGQAGYTQAQVAQSQATQNAGKSGALGSGLGSWLGNSGWVANK
jgi:hypothetical protein